MPDGRNTVDCRIREEDYGGGADKLGAAERTGTVRGMREGDGGGIVGIPQDDKAWEGGRGEIDLGRLGHLMRPVDVKAGLPYQGRAAELPSRGLHRTGRDEDGDVDELLQPACQGCRDHLGRGKYPPPKVITAQHSGPMEGAKR